MAFSLPLENPELRRGAIFAAAFFGSAIVFNGAKWIFRRRESRSEAAGRLADDRRLKAEAEARAELTIEKLNSLEWRRFEELVEGYLAACGLKPQRLPAGPVRFYLYAEGSHRPTGYASCPFPGAAAGPAANELREIAARDNVPDSYFITPDMEFIAKFNSLSQPTRGPLLAAAFRDDFSTPTCPKCEVKMVRREEEKAWGCRNFPRCHQVLAVRP